MKYLCLLVPQTSMAHLRFDFKRSFFSYWDSRKKSRKGEGCLKNISLKKSLNLLKIYFLKKPSPCWKFWKFLLHLLEIPYFFLITPGYSTCYYFFNHLEISCLQLSVFFSGIAHCTLFKGFLSNCIQ